MNNQPAIRHLFFLALPLAATILFSSCEWFKPAQDPKRDKVYKPEDIGEIQGTRVYDAETGEYRVVHEVNEQVQVVDFKPLPEDKYPPITSDGSWSDVGTQPPGGTTPAPPPSGKAFNVSLMLPFIAQQFNAENIDENSQWAIHFYAGAKVAYEALESDGVSLSVNVLDTEANTTKVGGLLRQMESPRPDLIIGPYRRDNVPPVADFAKKNKIPHVVPFTAQMGLAENNPFYIQMNPSLKSHCEAIARHARKRHRTEDVVLVVQDKPEEKERLKYFQDANAMIEGRSGVKFREYVATNVQNPNVGQFIKSDKTTVFIVPSWSNETFVYSVLRQLMDQKAGGDDIVVYGMPQWMGFEQIDYDFYERLQVHVSSAFFVDESDERVRQFKRKFFDSFGTVPREEAYLGHDAMLYFGKMLAKYGKDFPSRLDQEDFSVLHGKFDFERIVLYPEEHREQTNYYDQLENVFVHILKFRDFYFQPAE